jgi:hypothetical protein
MCIRWNWPRFLSACACLMCIRWNWPRFLSTFNRHALLLVCALWREKKVLALLMATCGCFRAGPHGEWRSKWACRWNYTMSYFLRAMCILGGVFLGI